MCSDASGCDLSVPKIQTMFGKPNVEPKGWRRNLQAANHRFWGSAADVLGHEHECDISSQVAAGTKPSLLRGCTKAGLAPGFDLDNFDSFARFYRLTFSGICTARGCGLFCSLPATELQFSNVLKSNVSRRPGRSPMDARFVRGGVAKETWDCRGVGDPAFHTLGPWSGT